jgi:thiamine transporter 2/3
MWRYDSTTEIAENGLQQNSTELAMKSNDSENIKKPSFSWNRATKLIYEHFVQAYTNKTVILWSIWWSLAMAGFLQIQSYMQLLWKEIDPNQENFYNGAVEALLTLFGSISALVAGFISSRGFEKYDLWILSFCSLLEGIMIIYSSLTQNVWIAYAMYVFFGILYMFMITIASATVAKNLADDCFALIFGINSMVALVIQTILTISVVSESGLGLSPRGQFLVFGGYFVVLAFVYFLASLVRSIYFKATTKNS